MGKTLAEIAQQLSMPKTVQKTVPEKTKVVEETKPVPKVQLIYAFNGTGKTRLSRELKKLLPPTTGDEDTQRSELANKKILYYSAFTEDLFYWDNDLELDAEPKLLIHPNSFTRWVLEEQGQDRNIVTNFQRYTNDKLTPRFNEEYKRIDKDGQEVTIKAFTEVTFSLEGGNDEHTGNLKISKGEESNFIWSIFYTLLEQAIFTLNDVQPDYPEPTPFDNLEYVFVDDPVSSLDDNHLIQLAVDLAQLVKLNKSGVNFIITTHNPLFFNVLCNEFGSDDKTERYSWKSKWFSKSRLERNDDGSLHLAEQPNDSPFAYHLHLISQLEEAIKSGQVEKYHFNLLRNILEKTATFLGYKRWEHLLPETNDGLPNPYAKRIVNFSSHSKHAAEEVAPLKPEEKKVLEELIKHIVEHYRFRQEKTT
ncbi:AAA family ATPase [Pseudomonas aeruginosa]|uniref:AAA family ATPase n=1 Tax=Pseudomonas aeruginosa TaxID=287 RepID=UPI001D0B39C2|nr:AAA family ATPase [Pseudomonas aeruginosa]EKV8086389.1 AAA family ATPase [Pseudomonas aeruginosa]MCC0228682.1 AAA family ATPase [Pseudomonas aeruginosa]MDU0702926.1 AAA family ATPase [Pseudomonas aeruginosa]HBO5683544.1 AAA family ATPase [Pseudomonas aeruginosa]HDU8951014.1 AAA family ATPase [Pseudomonas aeruginosa]